MVRLSQLSLVVFSLMAYGTPGISVFFVSWNNPAMHLEWFTEVSRFHSLNLRMLQDRTKYRRDSISTLVYLAAAWRDFLAVEAQVLRELSQGNGWFQNGSWQLTWSPPRDLEQGYHTRTCTSEHANVSPACRIWKVLYRPCQIVSNCQEHQVNKSLECVQISFTCAFHVGSDL